MVYNDDKQVIQFNKVKDSKLQSCMKPNKSLKTVKKAFETNKFSN